MKDRIFTLITTELAAAYLRHCQSTCQVADPMVNLFENIRLVSTKGLHD